MNQIVIILAVVNVVFGIGVLIFAFRLRRAFAALERSAQELAGADLPPVTPQDREVKPPGAVIQVRVLNPMALAARESWFARRFGSMAPATIHRVVHRRIVETLHLQLTDQGVEAEVELRREVEE